jgi:hypothetical protein
MRRTKEVIINTGNPTNRDEGKKFLITEMSSYTSEKWAARALNMLLASGLEVPEVAASAGMAGLASVAGASLLAGFKGLSWGLVEPLLDEMMTCVSVSVPIRPEPGKPSAFRGLLEDAEDIEELSTRLRLRKEIMELHLGFTWADFLHHQGVGRQAADESASSAPMSQTPSA